MLCCMGNAPDARPIIQILSKILAWAPAVIQLPVVILIWPDVNHYMDTGRLVAILILFNTK